MSAVIPNRDKDGITKVKVEAFKAKTANIWDGRSGDLYKKISGKKYTINGNGSFDLDFTIPYEYCKVEAIEFIGCELGDKVQFYVLDSPEGIFQQHRFGLPAGHEAITPNMVLDQFGIDVFLPDGSYTQLSQYDAEVYAGMVFRINYDDTHNGKTLYINYVLNEVKLHA